MKECTGSKTSYREFNFNIDNGKKSKLFIISLGGKIKDYSLFKNFIGLFDEYYAIAADSGLSHLNNMHLKCKQLIADFDSISATDLNKLPNDCKLTKLNVDKDFTDGEACFQLAKKFEADAYLIIASLEPNRFDHVLCNINLFMNFSKEIINNRLESHIIMSDGSCLICPLFNRISYSFDLNKDVFFINSNSYFSIVPRTDLYNLKISGLKYQCDEHFLDRNSSMTVSNKYIDQSFYISFDKGEAILIMNVKD